MQEGMKGKMRERKKGKRGEERIVKMDERIKEGGEGEIIWRKRKEESGDTADRSKRGHERHRQTPVSRERAAKVCQVEQIASLELPRNLD